MLLRRSSARKSPKAASAGQPQLTLAKALLLIEATLRYFARPLFFAGLFVGLAWLGIFTRLYPWAHLAALALFVILFFDALGRSKILWSRPSLSLAMRRVEEASGLKHRPFDTVSDRAVGAAADTHTLWQEHVLRARAQMRRLRWPKWNLDFIAARDPYHLRHIVAVILVAGLITGWGALGGRLIAAINPALGRIPVATATIDAWITPPEYTHLPPIMIATPAGTRYQGEVIKVPEGSTLHAFMAERSGDVPVLEANDQRLDFTAADDKDFAVTTPLTSGDTIAIHRGWRVLGSWKVQVVADTAPQVAFTDPPAASERKDVRIAYDAKDDYGVTSVALKVMPRASLPGISSDPVDYTLATLDEKDVKRVEYKDMGASLWSGMMVDMQLVATDSAGHKAESDKVAFTLPERVFLQPVARLLIEERKKLIANIFDSQARSETANLMAGLATQPASIGHDPVVMMSLRAGAVRLVIDRDRDSALSAIDILWQAAVRIEDGATGMAATNLKKAQQDLADALDRGASEQDVQKLLDRLHQALNQYLAEISTRMAAHPAVPEDLKQVMGTRTNVLTPHDLEKMMNDIRNLSASGSREEARQKLAQLQDILENMKTETPQLSAAQKDALDTLQKLQQVTKDQQALLDKTFAEAKKSGDEKMTDAKGKKGNDGDLAQMQANLLGRLNGLMKKTSNESLAQGANSMKMAGDMLSKGGLNSATQSQSEAVRALRQAADGMQKSLEQSMGSSMPGALGEAGDPFGRESGHTALGEPTKHQGEDHFSGMKVREILEEIQHRASDLTRSKTERDYIERLLQNF